MSVPDKMPIMEAKRLAAEWGVTSRTIYAWKRAGVDFGDKRNVCEHIASLRNPSQASLHAALMALACLNPKHLNKPPVIGPEPIP